MKKSFNMINEFIYDDIYLNFIPKKQNFKSEIYNYRFEEYLEKRRVNIIYFMIGTLFVLTNYFTNAIDNNNWSFDKVRLMTLLGNIISLLFNFCNKKSIELFNFGIFLLLLSIEIIFS